jgi:hypothetical protein
MATVPLMFVPSSSTCSVLPEAMAARRKLNVRVPDVCTSTVYLSHSVAAIHPTL